MARVVWPKRVTSQIIEIVAYIQKDDPAAAKQIGERLVLLGESLAAFPHRGRLSRNGTREMTTIWPYILRYRVEGDVVTILRIRHGAQRPQD